MQGNFFALRRLAVHAASTPTAVAVEQGAHRLSYGMLLDAVNDRLRALPRELIPGEIVAVEARRDLSYLIDFLALLARGAVVAPIDLVLPPGRREALLSELRSQWNLRNCEFSKENQDSETERLTGLQPSCTPAYIFFTSGSTGRPKPVLGAAESLEAFLTWQQTTFEIQAGDRIPFLTALGFDVSLRDMLLPLIAGGTLVIPEPSDVATPQVLVRWLEAERISRLHAVPSVARTWVAAASPDVVDAPLRTVFFAGEPLSGSLVNRWRARFPSTQTVVNFYGPTETTLAAFARIVTEEDEKTALISVGKPRPNTEMRFLLPGSRFEPQSLSPPSVMGSDGEIVIVTTHPSLGYLGRPADTRERFLELSNGTTAYRTGDLGRVGSDGSLVVTGRADDELKINGVRMHPNEVQQCLASHPGVSAAAIVADKSRPEIPRLVAFWVAAEVGPPPDEAELRQYLGERLPATMLPAVWRTMETLPVSANGKVDRRALQAEITAAAATLVRRVPTTAVERWLVEVCAILFDVPDVDLDSSFFGLGGTSLQVAFLIGKIEAELKISVSFASVFANPRIADLARVIEEAPASSTPSIAQAPAMENYPLSPQQRRWWNIYIPKENRSWATMVMPIDLPFKFTRSEFERELNELVGEQVSLRLCFRRTPEGICQASHEGYVSLTSFDDISDQTTEDQERFVQELRLEVANREIDPFEWPLFRTHLVRCGPGRHTLVFAIHHMISDGFSQNLTEQTLHTKLAAFAEGRIPSRSKPAFGYLDYALWARREEETNPDYLVAAEKYWDSVYNVPYAKVVFPEQWRGKDSDRGRAWCVAVPLGLGDRARDFCRRQGITVFSLFMAAKLLALHRLTERTDLVIGTPAAGRTVPGTEHVIGNFISLVTIRSRSTGHPSYVEYASDIMRSVALAMEHQSYQYDRLVQKLGLGFEQDRFPLTTMFMSYINFEGMRTKPLNLSDLGHKDLGYAVKFDLMSYLREHMDVFSIQVQYRNNLFENNDISKLVDCWLNQLELMIGTPYVPPVMEPIGWKLATAKQTVPATLEFVGSEVTRE